MTGPGRPPIGQVVEVRLTPNQLEWIDHYAKQEEISRAEAIREIIDIVICRLS